MLTAVVVGGIGVALLHAGGLANTHIKASPMVAIVLGASICGIGMEVSMMAFVSIVVMVPATA